MKLIKNLNSLLEGYDKFTYDKSIEQILSHRDKIPTDI